MPSSVGFRRQSRLATSYGTRVSAEAAAACVKRAVASQTRMQRPPQYVSASPTRGQLPLGT